MESVQGVEHHRPNMKITLGHGYWPIRRTRISICWRATITGKRVKISADKRTGLRAVLFIMNLVDGLTNFNDLVSGPGPHYYDKVY